MLDGSTIARAVLVLVAAAATVGSFRVFVGQEARQEPGQEVVGSPNPAAVVRSAGSAPAPGGLADLPPAAPEEASVRAVADPPPARPPPADPVPPAPAAAPTAPATPTLAAPAAAPSPVPAAGDGADAGGRVDLNAASVAALNRLAGGGSIGRAIVRHRPYRAVEDLLRKRVVGRATFERIKDQVAVR